MNFSRLTLDCWREQLAPTQLEQVLERIGSETLARLSGAGRFEWLPAQLHVRIATAPAHSMSREAFCQLWQSCMLNAFEKPLFRSIVQGGLRLFSATPEHFVRLIAPAWGNIARSCGTFEGEVLVNERASIVHWSGIPKTIRDEPSFALAGLGAFGAFYELLGKRKAIELDASELAVGYVRYLLKW